jgi:hypothetical protein
LKNKAAPLAEAHNFFHARSGCVLGHKAGIKPEALPEVNAAMEENFWSGLR